MQLFFLIVAFPLTYAASQQCSHSFTQPGFKLHGHVIKTIPEQSRMQCEAQCGSETGCHSINYYAKTNECELNSANHLSHPESLTPEASSQYFDFPARSVDKCSDNLCSDNQRCRPIGEDYRCLSCEELGGKEVLHFPRKSTEDKVIVENAFGPLTKFTLALWSRQKASSFPHTLVSHATTGVPDALTIFLHRDFTEVGVNDLHNRKGASVVDEKWHHLCLTWQSSDGQYNFYIDGALDIQGTFSQGNTIKKGAFMLGQDQDGYKTGLDPKQALQGQLASVNLWDEVFTSQEVSALAKSCPTAAGNVINWSTFKNHTFGEVRLVCSLFCLGP